MLTRVSRLAQKDGEITKEDANQHDTAKQLATRSDEVKRPELLINAYRPCTSRHLSGFGDFPGS